MLGPTPAGKKVWQRLQGHALPLRNLDGMDPIVCGKLIDRPFPTDRLESHFRLERTTVLPSLCRHLLVLPHGSMSLTYSVVQFLGSIIPIEAIDYVEAALHTLLIITLVQVISGGSRSPARRFYHMFRYRLRWHSSTDDAQYLLHDMFKPALGGYPQFVR